MILACTQILPFNTQLITVSKRLQVRTRIRRIHESNHQFLRAFHPSSNRYTELTKKIGECRNRLSRSSLLLSKVVWPESTMNCAKYVKEVNRRLEVEDKLVHRRLKVAEKPVIRPGPTKFWGKAQSAP